MNVRHLFENFRFLSHVLLMILMNIKCKRDFKPTQSQMSLVVSDIVLKNKFATKRYETALYTCNI